MEFTDFLTTSFYHPSSQNVWDSPHSLLLETFQPQTQPCVKLSSYDSAIFQVPPPNATGDTPVTSSTVESLCSDHLLINPPATMSLVKEEHKKSGTNKQLKPKKNSLKKQREARVAFMTKSDVDHLEDGYRWRKYGQKAVKNSPFPRSYYRCTTASCNVKKRVERTFRDPSTVVTTYEGQHTHVSPLTSRPVSAGGIFGSSAVASNLGSFGFPAERSTLISPQIQQLVHYHQQQELMSGLGGVGEYLNSHANGYGDDERVQKSRGLVKDNGLLQDVVPSHMLKEV